MENIKTRFVCSDCRSYKDIYYKASKFRHKGCLVLDKLNKYLEKQGFYYDINSGKVFCLECKKE